MRFYLASWIGDGSELNPYRPSVGDGKWAAVDLRPDGTRQEGRVLLATTEPLDSVPREVLDLGDLVDKIPRGISWKLEDALGVTLDQTDSIQAIIAELLILHGDNRPRGSRTRWRPLKQNRRGNHRIVVLGETLYDAPAPVGTTITESFNTANSTTLGPDLSWSEIEGGWEVHSNAARPDSFATASTARADSDLASDDHYVQADLTVLESSDTNLGIVLCRMPSTANVTGYGFRRFIDNDYRLERVESGSTTVISGPGTQTIALPETIKVDADGSTISGYIDGGASLLSTTDTNITTNTRGGLRGFTASGNSTTVKFDNFEAGDLAAATELTGTVSASIDIARATAEEVEQLDGQSDASLDVVGSLSQTQELSGAVQSAVQATGALTQTNELNGTVSTSIEATGSLTETEQLSGAAQTSVQASGALSQSQVLAGQSDASISASGALTVEGTNELSGSVQTSISTTGALTVEGTNELAGTVSTSVSATGALTQTHEATGTNQASIEATGSLTQTNELAGSVNTSIDATGALAQTQELGGSADTSISTSGALTIGQLADLQASLALAVGVTGALSQTQQLSQALAQTLSVVGALKQLQEANAQARSQLQVSGALTVTQEVTRGSNGVTDALVGSIGLSESLVGTVGVADATAGNVGVSDA